MLNELLEYLTVLSRVQGAGHYVNEEIKEVIKEIRLELGLEKDTSRHLVFEAKLGKKATFEQDILFEAVFGRNEEYLEVFFDLEFEDDIEDAVNVLNGMEKDVELRLEEYQNIIVVEVERQ